MTRKAILWLCIVTLNANSEILNSIIIEEKKEKPSDLLFFVEDFEDKNQKNLVEKLSNNVSFHEITDEFGSATISFRGIDYRATNYSEDLIPLYKTSTQNPLLINAINNQSMIISNNARTPSKFGVTSLGSDLEIINKKPQKEFEGSFNTILSQYEMKNSLSLNTKQDSFYIKSDFIYFNRDKYKLSKDFENTSFQDSKTRINSDRENKSIALKTGYLLNDKDEIAVKYNNTKSTYGNEPQIHGDNYYDFTRVEFQDIESFYGYFDHKDDNYNFYLRSYYDKFEDFWKIYKDNTYTTQKKAPVIYEDKRTGLLSKLELNKENSSLAFVLNYEENKHITKRESWLPSKPKYKYQTVKSSILYKHNINKLTIDTALTHKKYKPLNINYDGHSFSFDEAGSKDSLIDGQIAFDYKINNKNEVYLSMARTSKIPTMKQMFAFSDYIEPNPNLKAEISRNIELGMNHYLSDGIIRVSLYNYAIKNKIEKINDKYVNINRAKHQGFELRYMTIYKNHYLNADYAYSRAKDNTGLALDLIPRHKVVLSDKIELTNKLNTTLEMIYESKKFEDKEKDQIKSYTLFNTHASYEINKNLKTVVSIKNILDKNYELDYGMPKEGRNYYVSINYNF